MKCILPVFNYSNLVTCEIKGQLTPVIKLEFDQMVPNIVKCFIFLIISSSPL